MKSHYDSMPIKMKIRYATKQVRAHLRTLNIVSTVDESPVVELKQHMLIRVRHLKPYYLMLKFTGAWLEIEFIGDEPYQVYRTHVVPIGASDFQLQYFFEDIALTFADHLLNGIKV